jgi:hypothetical protein
MQRAQQAPLDSLAMVCHSSLLLVLGCLDPIRRASLRKLLSWTSLVLPEKAGCHQLPINAAGERERGRCSCDMCVGPFARASMSGTVRAQAHSPGQSIPIPTAADEGTTRRLLGKLHWVRHGAVVCRRWDWDCTVTALATYYIAFGLRARFPKGTSSRWAFFLARKGSCEPFIRIANERRQAEHSTAGESNLGGHV